MKRAIGIATLCGLMPLAASAVSITDTVDGTDGWNNIGGGFFTASAGGLTPQGGNNFWNALNAGLNRGAFKLFGTTFTDDRLKVTFNMGDRNDSQWSGGVTAFLFTDTNGDNTYQWGERIVPDFQSSPTPSDGWETWERIYNISADTTTADGAPVIGEEIGFFVVSLVDSGENMAFDGPLTIETEVVGVTAGTSSIINDYDYTETWTIGTGAGTAARQGYTAQSHPLPAAVAPLEKVWGNPPVSWSTTIGSIATDAAKNATTPSPWPGGTGSGTATGMTQSGGGIEWNFTVPYGLRNKFIVQFDTLLAAGRVDVFINDVGFSGSGNDIWTITENAGLAVFFRDDEHTNPAIGVFKAGVAEVDTGLTTGLAATEQDRWHNFAVQFDLDGGMLDFWVDEVHRGTFDYQSAFPALTASNAYIGIGSRGAGSDDRFWTDNFQVGGPDRPTQGTLFIIR